MKILERLIESCFDIPSHWPCVQKKKREKRKEKKRKEKKRKEKKRKVQINKEERGTERSIPHWLLCWWAGSHGLHDLIVKVQAIGSTPVFPWRCICSKQAKSNLSKP